MDILSSHDFGVELHLLSLTTSRCIQVFCDYVRTFILLLLPSTYLLLRYGFQRSALNLRAKGIGKIHASQATLRLLPSRPMDVLRDPLSFFCISDIFRCTVPVQLKWLNKEFYVLQGASNIRASFRNKSLSTFFFHGLFLQRFFLLPERDAQVFFQDEPEVQGTPGLASKHGTAETRSDFGVRSFKHMWNLLMGPGAQPLNSRLAKNLSKNMKSLHTGDDWKRWDDLTDVFGHELTRAFINSMCGSRLLQENSSFLEDLGRLHRNVTPMFLGVPRFMMPQNYSARDRCLATLKRWQQWAEANCDPTSISPEDGYDPYWGHQFFRERSEMYTKIDGFSIDTVTSHNLSFLWGATTNSTPAAFWATFEAYRDPQLLDRVRREARTCLVADSHEGLQFDVERLLKQPFIQAICAETLRLRVHGIIPRKSPKQGLNINHSTIPGNKLVFMSSTTAHMDPEVWSSGTSEDHPPQEFWPGRFLRPVKGKEDEFVFNQAGNAGSWIPFGGGPHMCPGRFLAKRTMVLSMAHFVTLYDCEIISDEGARGMSLRTFGFGTLQPAGKVPVKLRPRRIA